jgi:hypothetical protein
MVWKKLTKEDLEETKKHFASSGYVMQWFAMAQEVILTTLGPEWWRANCLIESKKPDPFLKTKGTSEDDRFDFQDRVVRLGHMLYSLQKCAGFETFIASLKLRDLEPTFFELQVAHLLDNSGYEVQFVEQKGHKGEDYDLIAVIKDVPVHIEAKSKRSGEITSSRALLRTLDKARGQLPPAGPGVIFLSIPEVWTRHKDAKDKTRNLIESFFRNTQRVNHVVIVWHQWLLALEGRASASLMSQHDNPKPRHPFALNPIVKTVEEPISLDPKRQPFQPSFW